MRFVTALISSTADDPMKRAIIPIIADTARIRPWAKYSAGPSARPRKNASRNEYVYERESVDPRTYSLGVIGSQLTKSALVDWIGWLSSVRMPKRIITNVVIVGIP